MGKSEATSVYQARTEEHKQNNPDNQGFTKDST